MAINLHLLREDPSTIIEVVHKKDPSFPIETLIDLDAQVRAIKAEIDFLRHQKNELAQQGKNKLTEEVIAKSREISTLLKQKEQESEIIFAEFKNLYLSCPNLISADVPAGAKDANLVVKVVGQKPTFAFTPKHHVELGALNGWFDFEAAARMTGSNFALYKGEAVSVVYALMLFMLNNNMRHGFSPVLPPYLVNESALEGASTFPRFKDEVYAIAGEDLYLTPTSEVNLTNMYRNHIFTPQELPVRMTAWTSCFRKEAGNYGATERGLIRIHQFEKVELYTICEPEESMQELDALVTCAENILQALGLHYRISLLAAQDCSFASAKTYDIEVWMPGQGIYKEVSSCSNCTDFQTRRCEIRSRSLPHAKPHLVHTLNGSSLALPRLMVALMETYQQEDGSIKLPGVLQSVSITQPT